MKAVFHETQRQHNPKHFFASGSLQPNPEVPQRVDALLGGLKQSDAEIIRPEDHGIAPIAAVHTPEYLTFLKHIHTRWQRIPDASDEVIPNIHPNRGNVGYPKSAVGQSGYHQADTACPISEHTWMSAYWSAQTALTAAEQVVQGEAAVYALCRPPGHHAFTDMAGGFCFLNNTAIAAQYCQSRGLRPAIVDVDLHHGNGTQGIFYARGDVLTVSVHADPVRYYPFFWGYELERVDSFGADVLVIALGLDGFEGDPFGGLSISTQGFARIAEACAGLKLPMIIVQEGGYLCPELGDNLASFLGSRENQSVDA